MFRTKLYLSHYTFHDLGSQSIWRYSVIAVTSGAESGRYPFISSVDAVVIRMKETGDGIVWSYFYVLIIILSQ